MEVLTTPPGLVAVVAVVLLLLALAGWWVARRKRTFSLQQHFGHEYDHAVEDLGSRTKAEAELRAREDRVGRLTILPIPAGEAARFRAAWTTLQARFVDNPKGVVAQAHQLLSDVMLARGYPVGDFDRRAADVSVGHPRMVEHYRAAQAIAVRDQRGEADTESQRQAVVHYRALFDELLEVAPAGA